VIRIFVASFEGIYSSVNCVWSNGNGILPDYSSIVRKKYTQLEVGGDAHPR